MDRYARSFVLQGGGGTDFCPAFAHIAELRGEGKLQELQGALYFTDGKGTYPARRQPYEVAFLFLDTGEPPPEVPPWAMRLVIEPEELIRQKPPALPPIDWPAEDSDELPQL